MKDALIVSALSIFPRKRGAWIMGWFARTGLSRLIVTAFVKIYGLNMDEADQPMSAYTTLNALFTRTLKPGARPVDPDPTALTSPVDGTIAAVGPAPKGQIDLGDGQTLDLSQLLGAALPEPREAIVIYLSPKDYHRVHVPCTGDVTRWAYIPGSLWPVFPAAVRRVKGLFSRNERALIQIDGVHGPVSVVMVGAFGVGRISLACCDLLTNTGGTAAENTLTTPQPVQAGDALGVFHLGSTVVLVLPGGIRWSVSAGDSVKMGQSLGRH
jgi:phosphatidylserine decarboxylase